MKRIIICLLAVWTFSLTNAAVIDTINVFSKSMQKNISVIVISPDNFAALKELPVVY